MRESNAYTRVADMPPGPELAALTVTIQVPAAELDRLVGDGATIGVWDGVVSDIAERYARRNAVAAAMDRHPAGRYARKRRHSHHLSRPSITSPVVLD